GTFGFYVGRLIVPVGVTAYMPTPPSGAGMMALAALGAAVVAFLVLPAGLGHGRDAGLRRFTVAWFLLTLAPALLVAVAAMLVTKASERYLYLPSVGLAVLAAASLDRLHANARPATEAAGPAQPRSAADARTVTAVGAVVVLGLAAATMARARIWR